MILENYRKFLKNKILKKILVDKRAIPDELQIERKLFQKDIKELDFDVEKIKNDKRSSSKRFNKNLETIYDHLSLFLESMEDTFEKLNEFNLFSRMSTDTCSYFINDLFTIYKGIKFLGTENFSNIYDSFIDTSKSNLLNNVYIDNGVLSLEKNNSNRVELCYKDIEENIKVVDGVVVDKHNSHNTDIKALCDNNKDTLWVYRARTEGNKLTLKITYNTKRKINTLVINAKSKFKCKVEKDEKVLAEGNVDGLTSFNPNVSGKFSIYFISKSGNKEHNFAIKDIIAFSNDYKSQGKFESIFHELDENTFTPSKLILLADDEVPDDTRIDYQVGIKYDDGTSWNKINNKESMELDTNITKNVEIDVDDTLYNFKGKPYIKVADDVSGKLSAKLGPNMWLRNDDQLEMWVKGNEVYTVEDSTASVSNLIKSHLQFDSNFDPIIYKNGRLISDESFVPAMFLGPFRKACRIDKSLCKVIIPSDTKVAFVSDDGTIPSREELNDSYDKWMILHAPKMHAWIGKEDKLKERLTNYEFIVIDGSLYFPLYANAKLVTNGIVTSSSDINETNLEESPELCAVKETSNYIDMKIKLRADMYSFNQNKTPKIKDYNLLLC